MAVLPMSAGPLGSRFSAPAALLLRHVATGKPAPGTRPAVAVHARLAVGLIVRVRLSNSRRSLGVDVTPVLFTS